MVAQPGHKPILENLIQTMHSASRVAVLTGAGMSAESGVPTFREAQTGLWSRYRAEDLATPQAFEKNPRLVWEWYVWRREIVSRAEPNPGHRALVRLEFILQRRGVEFTLITQNVDGLHQRAGSQDVIELHGNILRTRCSGEGILVEQWQERDEIPPHCPQCGGLLRPEVVWFGENLPPSALESAWQAAQTSHVFFSIGTSNLVEPAASLPYVALRSGAQVVEINPNETPLSSSSTYVLRGPVGVILPQLLEQLSI
jgi:NAD-dependent deacetylase